MKRLNASKMIGLMVALIVPCVLVGCEGKDSQAPAGGYKGVEKDANGKNTTNMPGYNTNGGATGVEGGKKSTPKPPGSTGQ